MFLEQFLYYYYIVDAKLVLNAYVSHLSLIASLVLWCRTFEYFNLPKVFCPFCLLYSA